MKIIRDDKNEIWFNNSREAEQYCYDNCLNTIGIEITWIKGVKSGGLLVKIATVNFLRKGS